MDVEYKIHSQFKELESYGYDALVFGFRADEVLYCATSSAEKCVTTNLLEYIRAVIVASKHALMSV